MKRYRLSIVSFALVVALLGSRPITSKAQDAATIARDLGSVTAPDLQTIPAHPSSQQGERWIVWDNGFGDGQAVRLALCGSTGRCRWQHDWTGAYEPTIQRMGSWSTGGEDIFLLLYNQGAEAQTAVVVGLKKTGSPIIHDQVDAALVAVSPRVNGIEIDAASGLPERWECLRWNKQRSRFASTRCR